MSRAHRTYTRAEALEIAHELDMLGTHQHLHLTDAAADAILSLARAAAPDLLAENTRLSEENERLRALLRRGFDLMCVKDYEVVGPGEEPVLKDGVQDRWMAEARAALAGKDET